MKNINRISRLLAFILLLLHLFISTAAAQLKDSTFNEELAPGVIHSKIFRASDTLSFNILKIDLRQGDYYLRAVKAHDRLVGREKTSQMASRFSDSTREVLGAVNADFFDMKTGEVENNMVIEGQFLKALHITDSPFDPMHKIHSQFAFTYNKKPLIGKFSFAGELQMPDKSINEINRINSKDDSNSLTLYNFYQGEETPEAKEKMNRAEVELTPVVTQQDTFYCVATSSVLFGGRHTITKGKIILSGSGAFAQVLEKGVKYGDTLRLVARLNPYFKGIRTLSGGWPQIVANGLNIADQADSIEGTFPKFSKVRHPRTGIGFSIDSLTIYLITVDGRQESSSGLTLGEFADLMISEGVFEGLNLDGGGSTTMVINGKVVNSPSDKEGERPVGSCLLLIKNLKTEFQQ
ncbi:MAG TPA: phosphodiester glycosidase family protein [Ignavibacteriales bacterium]|nr:phosphodiester glycosidase family protein [Ignavibacteriales bacterium]